MIIDDVMDEVDYMEDLATEYLIYLDGDQTEEMLYKAIEGIYKHSFIVSADDAIAVMHTALNHKLPVKEVLREIFDFEGLMGYFDDDEVEEDTWNECLAYFNTVKSDTEGEFKNYLTNG